jgi:superfamily II RNA helicase
MARFLSEVIFVLCIVLLPFVDALYFILTPSYKPPSGITKYDEFQEEAFKHIKLNHSLVVSAPTGAGTCWMIFFVFVLFFSVCLCSRSGKTEIALIAIEQVLRSSPTARVFYISPTKALVNQIYLEVMSRFGGDWRPSKSIAGILTADFQIATNARV